MKPNDSVQTPFGLPTQLAGDVVSLGEDPAPTYAVALNEDTEWSVEYNGPSRSASVLVVATKPVVLRHPVAVPVVEKSTPRTQTELKRGTHLLTFFGADTPDGPIALECLWLHPCIDYPDDLAAN